MLGQATALDTFHEPDRLGCAPSLEKIRTRALIPVRSLLGYFAPGLHRTTTAWRIRVPMRPQTVSVARITAAGGRRGHHRRRTARQ